MAQKCAKRDGESKEKLRLRWLWASEAKWRRRTDDARGAWTEQICGRRCPVWACFSNEKMYRVTSQSCKNLLLTLLRQSQQVVGRRCGSLLPKQDDRTSQIQVNGRFLVSTILTGHPVVQ